MTKTFAQRNKERIARVREDLLAAAPPPKIHRSRLSQNYHPRPIDYFTGICYYEYGVGLIDLCHDCARQRGYREPIGGSLRRCQKCGKRAKEHDNG